MIIRIHITRLANFYNIFKTDTLSVVYEVKNNNKTYGYIVAHMPTSIIKKVAMM